MKQAAIVVVGAGLAGLAAAQALSQAGRPVLVLEARDRAGGRAGSFVDAATGALLDACQHVSMGCCTNLAYFCQQGGVGHLLAPQSQLFFMTPDGTISAFASDHWPAPFHLTRSFLQAHYLTWEEKARIAYGLACLRLWREPGDPPFAEWLRRHHQTPRTIARFWGLVLVSALNEQAERVGLRYARKVFVDGMMRHRDGFRVEVPAVPLGELYGSTLLNTLARQGVSFRFQSAVRRLLLQGNQVTGLELRDGQVIAAQTVVVAVPWHRVLGMLPEAAVEMHPSFANLRKLDASPITSVHLWTDRRLTPLPHLVLIDCVGQWLFLRGESAPGEHYAQVVVSASRCLRAVGHDQAARLVLDELQRLFGPFTLLRHRVVTEPAATFCVVPGVDQWRPTQTTPIEGLYLAGDWTQTDWPATMEGAVRSGYLAAGAILGRRLVRPDLGKNPAPPASQKPTADSNHTVAASFEQLHC
ncbi:MAG: hydroxysqualene dehydroxylase HpnE [Gemmataceae bacterium]